MATNEPNTATATATALAPVASFEPIKIMPPTQATRELLISEAGAGGDLNQQTLWLPLTPDPSATWRDVFVRVWRKELGDGYRPALSDKGLGISMAVISFSGGLNSFLAHCQRIVTLTNLHYEPVWRDEKAEIAARESAQRTREESMMRLLDGLGLE